MSDRNKSSCEGKGNAGMFTERITKICPAGIPSAQPHDRVADALQQYLLKDEVDALLNDAIVPPEKPKPLPPLRHPIPLDMRNAGPFENLASLVNPPMKTRFQTLVEDFKNTSYKSYWNQETGLPRDPVPMLPEGMDIKSTTFGKKTHHIPLYEIILPKEPLPDKTPLSKFPGVQLKRNYTSSFNPNVTFGYRSLADKRGTLARCCLTDDKIPIGTDSIAVLNVTQAEYKDKNHPKTGKVINSNKANPLCGSEPDKNLTETEGVPECLTFCPLNQNRVILKKCLGHLNSVRKCLRTRVLPSFFHELYLNLKYLDTNLTNWLPKDVVYKMCKKRFVVFDSSLIEPLLYMWNIFNGSEIEYKPFLQILNYREHMMDIPKVPDISDECLHFSTTYREMVKPNQQMDYSKAGVPSGRYLDMDYPVTPHGYCKANIVDLPHESDAKTCLSPSILTLFNVTHRDMFAKRDPTTVRKLFERAGERFDDNTFQEIWAEAQKYHSEGWVCYDTFRRALRDVQKGDTVNKTDN